MKLVVGVFVIFCVIFHVHAMNAKSSSGYEVHRSLILRNLEEKPRAQRPGLQRPGGGGGLINTNLVPDIVCFYARYGRWPNYPNYLRQSVRWMSQLVFSMSDEGVRSFCRQFNYFTGLDKRNIGGPTRRIFQNRRTTRRRFITTRRVRRINQQQPTRRRTTTTTELPFYDSTFDYSTTEFSSGSDVTDPPTGSGTGNINNNGQGSGSSASGNANTASGSQGNTSGSGQSASSGSSGNLIASLDTKSKLKKMKYYGINMLKPIPFYP